MRSQLVRIVAAAAAIAVITTLPVKAQTPADTLRQLLESGRSGDAIVALEPLAKTVSEARMALGFAQFTGAVERLGQGLFRHGLMTPSNPFLPIVRLPIPPNARPEPLDYEKLRAIYQGFLDDLAAARKSLVAFAADPASSDAKLVLDLNAIKFTIAPTPGQALAVTLPDLMNGVGARPTPRRGQPNAPPQGQPTQTWEVAFDRTDALWLAGYTHMLGAMLEFVMAHDWHETFDATGHLFFAGARRPANLLAPDPRDPTATLNLMGGGIADQIALLHLVHWPAGDKVRLGAARQHLKSAVALSRETWKSALAETDDDREWLPSPRQQNRAVPGLPITDEIVAGWLKVLDDFDDLLDGRKLLGHWRFNKGIDLKMVFEEPQPFDLVLWVTGHGSMPFLKDGPTISGSQWQLWQQLFRNNFLGYAIFIN